MIHIDLNEVALLSIKSTEIHELLETWRVQNIVVYRTRREYQSGRAVGTCRTVQTR